MKKINWIFFDIGGVLLDDSRPEKKHLDLLYEIAAPYNLDLTRSEMDLIRIKMSSRKGRLSLNILKYLIKNPLDLKKAEKKYYQRNSEVGYYENSQIRPDAKVVLSQLGKKYQLGLIANQTALAKEKLKAAGIYNLLHHQSVSEDHRLIKPDPRYFQSVFKETGADPYQSVLVDDNIERGLLPAKKLGMTTVWFRHTPRDHSHSDFIDYTIDSLTELLKIF